MQLHIMRKEQQSPCELSLPVTGKNREFSLANWKAAENNANQRQRRYDSLKHAYRILVQFVGVFFLIV